VTRRRRPSGWRIGVDLGGTWIRVRAEDARGRTRSALAPSPGLAGLPAFLARLWQRWKLCAADVTLIVASRGVWTRAERSAAARRLARLARAVRVISDTEAAYRGALGAAPGVLLLAGTGSMALGRDRRGRWARAGGLGPLLGDEGSAFWIGREWLRLTSRAGGGLAARRDLRAPDPAARIAARAPAVLRRARRGSPPARAIVARAQAALADLLVATARRLRLPSPVAVSWSGSLLGADDFRAGVWRAARGRGLVLIPRAPRASAVDAARALARGRGGHR